MSDQESTTPVPIGRSSNYVDVYASIIRMNMTPTDFTVIFGVNEDLGPGLLIPQDRASVRVSPQTLRILIENAALFLRAWEAQFGKVNLPQGVLEENQETEKRLSTAFTGLVKRSK